MEQILIAIVGAAMQEVPALIESIRASQAMTIEQKKAALDLLQTRLKTAADHVAAVVFDDV